MSNSRSGVSSLPAPPRAAALAAGIIFILSSLLVRPAPALQSQSIDPGNRIAIEEGGDLRIEGSAGIVDYTCRARRLSGRGDIENRQIPRQNLRETDAVRIIVSIPVRSLECGKRAMNRDMYEALKADEHPSIIYRLLEAKVSDSVEPGPDGWLTILSRGVLEIAGVRDTTEVSVRGRMLNEDRFQVRGSKLLRMDTFEVTPPSALMGLIRADNRITVHFDVTVRLGDSSTGNGES